LMPLHPCLFFSSSRAPRDLHSFPTRRSSDLELGLRVPYPTVRSELKGGTRKTTIADNQVLEQYPAVYRPDPGMAGHLRFALRYRSEEHTSELQSRRDLVCRLLLEKKKKKKQI